MALSYASRTRVMVEVKLAAGDHLLFDFPRTSRDPWGAHQREAAAALVRAQELDHDWLRLVQLARARYGDHGALISGVYRAHFPDAVKDELRVLARKATALRDAAAAEWRKTGRTQDSFRALLREVERRIG